MASTWAFEAQGPGSIPGGGAISEAKADGAAISEAKADGAAISEAKADGGAATNPVEIDFMHGLRDRDHSCSG